MCLPENEYKRDNPNRLMYTQFCERYKEFKKTNQISLHIEHNAGKVSGYSGLVDVSGICTCGFRPAKKHIPKPLKTGFIVYLILGMCPLGLRD